MSAADVLIRLLTRPDLAPLVGDIAVTIGDGPDRAFLVQGPRRVVLSASALAAGGDPVAARHALELCLMLGLTPGDPALAGLAAARCAALFRVIAFPPAEGAPPVWHAAMVAETAPTPATLASLWPALAPLQADAPAIVSPETAARLAAVWPLLGPTEHLIASGGDTRLHIDPVTGLNAYGCSPRPRPWAITFASSTASSISERGYAAAEEARRRVVRDAIHGQDKASRATEAARIRRAIAAHYGLSGDVRVLIVPSGTDGELLALGIALSADAARPLTNLLVGPDESGSGVPLAAAGRHFCTVTARGVPVTKGEALAGIPADLEVASVPVRSADGAARPAAAITADVAGVTTDALARGRRVLFHILDLSKTGLLAPTPAGPGWPRARDDVDVLVDASQARLSAASARGYVEGGAMVLLTGSKFFTGPPFAGALLVPPALARRLDGEGPWPAGFADYFGDRRDNEVSVGVALRWEAALAEMSAFAALGETVAADILRRFGERVEAAIRANPDLRRHEAAAPERPEFAAGWDRLPTIFTVSVRRADGRLCGMDDARRIYTWLNTDLSGALPPGSSASERRLAARIAHIGQPAALADGSGPATGAFRLSAGARVVSGEPSQFHLDLEARIEREIEDALAVLDKVSLIVRHFDRIRAADPPARF